MIGSSASETGGLVETLEPDENDARSQVFISYGRVDAVDLAERLERDLGSEFRVWRDGSALVAGEVFTDAIRVGIENSAVVLGILSPHSVRDGATRATRSLCLNELHEASERLGKPVVLAMAETCTAPLTLNDLHWIDFRDRRQPGRYEAALKELRGALRHVLAGGRVPRVAWHTYAPTLRPAFDLFLAERRDAFCGRQWVFDDIEAWRRNRQEKAMIIVGEPGIGKSAIVADLVERNLEGQVLAYHCCRRDDVATLQPGRFVLSLAIMLAQRLEAYAARIAQHDVREELSQANCQEIPEHAFEAGVLAPLREIPAPEIAANGACYVLVDALDEAALFRRTASQRTILEILGPRLGMFPPWLRLLATTRPRSAGERFRDAYLCRVSARGRDNLRDIRGYIDARLAGAGGELPARTASTLLHRSGGNFLYLKFATDAILAGRFRGGEVDSLPHGLIGLYTADFSQHFDDPPGERYAAAERLLSVIAAAQQPLTPDHLARALAVSVGTLNELLAPLAAYVPERGGAYAFFHKSFADWLRDRGNAYRIDESKGHAALARVVEEVLCDLESDPDIGGTLGDPVRSYVLRHGTYHLVHVGQFARAIDLLSLLAWYEQEAESIGKPVLGGLTRYVIVGLRRCTPEEAAKIDPAKLVALLRDFYEIEPLASALDLLVRHHRDAGAAGLLDELLSADNFVVRYALSEALADACTAPRATVTVAELAFLLTGDTLNRRELGGYALRLVYARKPDLIVPDHLEILGNSETYPGRSALGDLLLNLVFRRRYRRDMVRSQVFWQPIWDFHRLDVVDLDAADAFMAGQALPAEAPPAVVDSYQSFQMLEAWRRSLLAGSSVEPSVRNLLEAESYFSLGRFVGRFRRAREALAQHPDLTELMRLFFGHPLWSVAEAAASVLSSIVEEEPPRRAIITRLFEEPQWRVRFGATEAAFAIRHVDRATSFHEAVRRFHADPNCRLRALCAENLVSTIVDCGPVAADALLRTFETEIRVWLRDEDCWVLEHMFRLMRTLDARAPQAVSRFSGDVSRLVADAPDWFRLGREAFLLHIEARKRALVPVGA